MTETRHSWDERHTGRAVPAPDPWLVRRCSALLRGVPGPLLDLACGLGQNALWAASLGLPSTGVDASREALALATAEGVRRGLPTEFRTVTLGPTVPPPPPSASGWGAILVFHYLDRDLLPALPEALLPGGLLVYKTHLSHALRGAESRPRRPAFLLRSGELLGSFPTLDVLEYQEWGQPGEAFAALVARRGYSR